MISRVGTIPSSGTCRPKFGLELCLGRGGWPLNWTPLTFRKSKLLSESNERTSSGAFSIGRSVQRSLLRYEFGKLGDVTQWPCCGHETRRGRG